MQSVAGEFSTVKELVMHVLKMYPNTRSSDTFLYLKCCELKGAYTTKEMMRLGLSVITVHKIRQKIQNGDGLYKPESEVVEVRESRNGKVKEYMVSN